MDELLFGLDDALSSSAFLALGAAVTWGVISVLLSPCHLGTIPLVVGFVGAGNKAVGRWRGATLAFSFAGGMLLAIAVVGLAVVGLGQAVKGFGAVTNYVIAGVFLLAGLHLVGLLPLPMSGLSIRRFQRRGVLAAAFLGLVVGIGLSPCTFAFLAPILAVTFGSAATRPVFGYTLLLAFGVGHCGVIGFAGSSIGFVQRYLDWNSSSKALMRVKVVCGCLVLVSAGVLIYTA